MKITPLGYRVLIKPDIVEEKTKSGIVLTIDKKAEQRAQVSGVILDIGPDAWSESKNPHCCSIGDRVLFQRYSGMRIPDDLGNMREDLLVLNDTDISAKVEYAN